MPGNSTLSLLIETKTSGANELSRLELALNRLADASEKAGKKTDDAGKKSAAATKAISDNLRSIGENPLGAAGSAVEKFGLSLGKIGGIAVGAVAGIAAVSVGAYELAKSYASATQEQANFAIRVGISTAAGQRFGAMAKIAGVDIGVLESSSRLVAAALEDTGGKGARAAKALEALGVSTRTISGDSRELGEVTTDVIEKLAGVESITKRTALANAILGRGSKELQPLIANYAELQSAVKQLGVGLDENGTKQLATLNREIKIADVAFDQLKRSLAEKIAPVLIPIIRFITTSGPGAPATLEEVRRQGYKIPAGIAPATELEKRTAAEKAGFKDPYATAAQEQNRIVDQIGKFAAEADDLARGKAKSGDYRKQLADTDETFIKNRIEEIRGGGVGPGGEKINGIDYDRQSLTSNDVGAKEKEAAKKRVDDGEAEIKQLEQRLKTIEEQKSIELEILKIRQEAADIAKNPYGTLPTQRKFIDLTTKPGITDTQFDEISDLLAPQYEKEKADAIRKAIAVGKEQTDAAAEAAGFAVTPKTAEALSQQLRERTSKGDAQFKLQQEQEQKRLEQAAPILNNSLAIDRSLKLSNTEGAINIQGILGGPGTELNTAARLASAKKASLQDQYTFQLQLDEKEYAYTDVLEEKKQETRLKYAQEVAQVEIQLAEQVAQEQKKQREQGREFAGGLFDAAISHQVPKFFQSYGQNIGKTIFQNGTQDIFAAAKYQVAGQGTITNPTALGKLLQGTPFGLDPLKGAGDPLKGATDLNTAATTSNTGILQRLTEFIESRLSFSTSNASGAAGDLSNAFSFAGGAGTGLGPQLFGDTSSAFSFGNGSGAAASDPFSFLGGGAASQALGFLTSGQPSALANLARLGASGASDTQLASAGLGLLKPGGALGSFFGGLSFGGTPGTPGGVDYSTGTFVPGTDPKAGVSVSSLLGTGVQVGGGVLGLINGLNTGGAKGGLQAAGGAAAAAGGILSSISSVLSIAGPIGAAVGSVLGLVSAFVGDPKQNRQKAIAKTSENYQFYQPDAINLSEGTNGGFSDYERTGNVRSSNISPYPSVSEPYYLFRQHVLVPGQTNSQFGGQSGGQTIVNNNTTITAMDSQSFADYTAQNHQAIADAFLTNMDRGNTNVVDRLRTNLGTPV